MNAPGLHATSRALTEREVSDLLGLSVATLRAWRHRGQGPRFLRLGRAVRYLPADLETFVRASVVEGGAERSGGRGRDGEVAHP
ncbi:helix-turn-helix transcriptional regulator [Luteitalea sp.]